MEVASPLAFAPAGAGSKRSLACSPQLLSSMNRTSLSNDMDMADDSMHHSAKRRRFHTEPSSPDNNHAFPSQSNPFFALPGSKNLFSSTPSGQTLKRSRPDLTSAPQNDLSRVVDEQAAVIESLKKDKSGLETSLDSLKTDHERIAKENQILRKAVTIQQERQGQAENELKAAHQYRAEAEDKMKKLEQVILSLRYHLQAQQQNFGNDFLNNRPPDVF